MAEPLAQAIRIDLSDFRGKASCTALYSTSCLRLKFVHRRQVCSCSSRDILHVLMSYSSRSQPWQEPFHCCLEFEGCMERGLVSLAAIDIQIALPCFLG